MVAENWWLPYIGFIVTLYSGDLIFDFSNRMPRRRFRGIPTACTLKRRLSDARHMLRAQSIFIRVSKL